MEETKDKLENFSGNPGTEGADLRGWKEPYNNRSEKFLSWKEKLILLSWIVGVCAVGLFAVNQYFEFHYKAQFLKAPCALCLELNPEVSKQCFIREDRLFPNGAGGWNYENGSPAPAAPNSAASPINWSQIDLSPK